MHDLHRRPEWRRRDRKGGPVYFTRHELKRLLGLYSRRVMNGEWRDYAIDHTHQGAVFSIFRHSYDRPLFRISKHSAGPNGSGVFQLHSGPQKLKQSRDIDEVLRIFERELSLVR